MTYRITPSRVARALRPAALMAGLLFALGAAAGPLPPDAPTTSDGNYTVTPRGCNSSSGMVYCAGLWLEERASANASWRVVGGTFVDKPPGTYAYRSVDYHCDAWYGWCITQYSSAVNVVVTDVAAPPAEPLEAQLDYRYRVRAGNVAGDAGIDLLVERTTGPVSGGGVVDKALLQNAGGGLFQVVTPSTSQLGSSAWQPTNLSVAVEDMNADGFADVVVNDVASVVPGAHDVLIFASGDAYDTRPQFVRALDAPLQQFTQNLTRYMADNAYFSNNAPMNVATVTYFYSYCPTTYSIDDWSMASMLQCVDMYFVDYRVVKDYSVFSDDAVEIWRDETAVANGSLTPLAAAERIADRIENVIGMEIGGWDLREIFGSGPGIDDAAERRGLDGFLAVIGIGNAHAQQGNGSGVGAGTRQDDRIYIVGRYLFGSSVNKMHTALLYRMPVSGVPTWYSAFDSDRRSLFDGRLVAQTSDPRDAPMLMRMTLGEAQPPGTETRFSYFFVNMLAAHDHYRGLSDAARAPYDAIPEIPCGGCNGRNSNGYVHGLVAATGGRPEPLPGVSLDGLTGWEYPVEPHYFGR